MASFFGSNIYSVYHLTLTEEILPYNLQIVFQMEFRKRQMIHTFTPSNQNVTIGSGGDANETFTGRVERNH